MHHTLKISISDYWFSRAYIGLSQVQMFYIFDVKYGLDKPYFKVLTWYEVASFDFMRFIFEVGGVLEHVISAVCILGISIPPLGVAEEVPGLRTASAGEQSCCWSRAAVSTVGLLRSCWLLPFQLLLSLGLELFLTADSDCCGSQGAHAKEPGASGDPALLPASAPVHITELNLHQKQMSQLAPNLALQCGSSPLFPWSQELLPTSKTQQKPELPLCTRVRA